MSSYHNLLVSNAHVERSELAGYRVASGAKAEITPDAIRREVGETRTDQGLVRWFALLLAVSTALVFAGIHDAGAQNAQETSGMVMDADGIEPPDMGVAYTLPTHSAVVTADRAPTSEHAGVIPDGDGIEPPDIGVAFDTGKAFVAFVKRQQELRALEIVADADGIEPPDMGVAYDTSVAYQAYVERHERANRIAERNGGRK